MTTESLVWPLNTVEKLSGIRLSETDQLSIESRTYIR